MLDTELYYHDYYRLIHVVYHPNTFKHNVLWREHYMEAQKPVRTIFKVRKSVSKRPVTINISNVEY